MPTTLNEGDLTLTFPDGWEATKYDDWAFYARFISIQPGTKGVDVLAFEAADKVLWLIELKDYRGHPRLKTVSFWDEVALKARDTLEGVFAAGVDTSHPDQAFAKRALTARKLRIVLHLEQPANPSKLSPRVADRANVQQKLKQIVKPIDAHPKVIEMAAMNDVAWTAV